MPEVDVTANALQVPYLDKTAKNWRAASQILQATINMFILKFMTRQLEKDWTSTGLFAAMPKKSMAARFSFEKLHLSKSQYFGVEMFGNDAPSHTQHSSTNSSY